LTDVKGKALVTGANGFVGSAVCAALRARGDRVVGAVRKDAIEGHIAVGNLDGNTDWRAALEGCAVVVHCAARVHVMADADSDPLRAYREVNVDGSVNLARQAAAAGVRRMVFVSSIKVNGEATRGIPYRASDVPAPVDPYGVSKLEAEQALLALGRETGMEIVIVRPPLVYGPGVKANFRNLIKLVRKGFPLPFGSLRNRRSMVALDNLVNLLMVCSTHPAAPGQVFLAADGVDLTIGDLVTMIARAQNKRQMLVPVPAALMRVVAGLLGKTAVAGRLLDSLQVDIVHTQAALEWTPVISPQAAIDKTVAAFLRDNK
jgi:nucleoside-diphosphate-sugar epimerase